MKKLKNFIGLLLIILLLTGDVFSAGFLPRWKVDPGGTELRAIKPTVTDVCNSDGSNCLNLGVSGGDVEGPASAVDSTIAIFDGTTGKLLKNAPAASVPAAGAVIISEGVSGGQTINGGIGASDDLILSSTAHATKGNINFGNSTYDEVNNRLGIGITPVTPLHAYHASVGEVVRLQSGATQTYMTFINTEVTGDDNVGYIGTTPTNSVVGYDAMIFNSYSNRDAVIQAGSNERMRFNALGNIGMLGDGFSHTIGASVASGTASFETVVNNTQTNPLTINSINLGTSAVGHVGISVNARGASTNQIAYLATIESGYGYYVTEVAETGNTAGFYYTTGNPNQTGNVAFKSVVTSQRTHLHQDINVSNNSTTSNTARTLAGNSIRSLRTSSSNISDDYDTLYINKHIQKSTSSTFNSTGSAVKIEITATSFGGTLNESSHVLELVQDVDSTGDLINASLGATEVFVIEDGGAFNPQTADPCPTRDSGYSFYNATSDYPCFCNGVGDDVKSNDNTTACF